MPIDMQEVLWTPTPEFCQQSNLKTFETWLLKSNGFHFANYQELWQWSIDDPGRFWSSIADYFGVRFYSPFQEVLTGAEMPDVKWFEGASLNYAEHIFRLKTSYSDVALAFQNEEGRREVTWGELERSVRSLQKFLVDHGVSQGDCVAGYLPNIPQAVAAFIACNSLGVVWTCCSPDFGKEAVIDRFSQAKPCLLIVADGYQYGGIAYDRIADIEEIRAALSSVRQTLLIRYLDHEAELPACAIWSDLPLVDEIEPVQFTPVPFNHPIWILYSSGTTGKPKAITHSHGGALLEHLKYLTFHNDVKPGEYFFWFTTTGWMMWNYVLASMLAGGIPVLFDGSPAFPSLRVLWQMAEDLGVRHFGTSPSFLSACMKADFKLGEEFDLSQMRSLSATGSPLPPDVFQWAVTSFNRPIWLISMSGGTDVCTAFVGGNPCIPVYKGYIQSRALGVALYGYSAVGARLDDGTLGEMVIEKPMPSMPIYFWNDAHNERYRKAYFSLYPGKWRHGDWVSIMENGSLIIQGRSDAVLNRKGIRIGTAEIYNVLDQIDGIKDSLIVNLERPNGDDVMPLFVQLEPDQELDDGLIELINSALRKQCSPRHVPSKILAVPDIPYTLSGKKMEVPVKKALMNMTSSAAINQESIRNPEAMEYFLSLEL